MDKKRAATAKLPLLPVFYYLVILLNQFNVLV